MPPLFVYITGEHSEALREDFPDALLQWRWTLMSEVQLAVARLRSYNPVCWGRGV